VVSTIGDPSTGASVDSPPSSTPGVGSSGGFAGGGLTGSNVGLGVGVDPSDGSMG
jgi:hypothetical protein